MKQLINLFDSETRAMAFVQMELFGTLEKQNTYTGNEEKLKLLLKERLHRMVDATSSMQGLINGLKGLDEFELGHGEGVEEILGNNVEL